MLFAFLPRHCPSERPIRSDKWNETKTTPIAGALGRATQGLGWLCIVIYTVPVGATGEFRRKWGADGHAHRCRSGTCHTRIALSVYSDMHSAGGSHRRIQEWVVES